MIGIVAGIATAIASIASLAAIAGDRDRQRYNQQIQSLIDLAGNQKEALINKLSTMSEDTARIVSELGYATRGGTAFNYMNKKQQDYLAERKANLARQEQLSKQQTALNKLMQ